MRDGILVLRCCVCKKFRGSKKTSKGMTGISDGYCDHCLGKIMKGLGKS